MVRPDETAVREQVERVLGSASFRNSRRASAMLRYTVERTLCGEGDTLKERTIGVEVFGRPAGYDTAADHVVRSTAGDVRRRLAQYYQEAGGQGAIRIDFPPGSYVPRFAAAAKDAPAGSANARFWAPLLEGGRTVLLCIGAPGLAPVLRAKEAVKPEDPFTLGEMFASDNQKVAFSDAATLAKLAGFLAARGAPYRILHESEAGLDDLRQGPAVLIGALNNDWGLRLSDQLRFTFSFNGETLGCSILDNGKETWTVALETPVASMREDRGVITRVISQTTGQPTVLAAGVTMLGTLAAGELLTNPACMPDAPWERLNAQILFSTKVLRGSATAPRALETWFW